jgi:hypothetical protein
MSQKCQNQTQALRECSEVVTVNLDRLIERELKSARWIWLNHLPTTEAASPLLFGMHFLATAP